MYVCTCRIHLSQKKSNITLIMVKYCSAYGCKQLQATGSGIQFHRFPFSRPAVLQKWVHAIGRDKWKPTISSTLCSKHFTDDCYQVRPGVKVRLLKEDAVPSVFNFPNHLQQEKNSRQPFLRSSESVVTQHEEAAMTVDFPQPMETHKSQYTQTTPIPSPDKARLRKKIKSLQMRENRLNKQIASLIELIATLKNERTSGM